MLTSGDPRFDPIITGLLWVAGVAYALGAVVLLARMYATPDRGRTLSRLAGAVNLAPALVGLVCLGFLIGAVSSGLRPGHEEQFLSLLVRPLPAIAMLSSAAGFLAGLLGTARPSRTALALGGLITVLTTLMAAAVAGVVVIAWQDAPDASEQFSALRVPFARLFTCLALFPAATLGLSWVSARVGRGLLGWLQLEASPPVVGSGTRASSAVPLPAQPVWLRRSGSGPAPPPETREVGTTTSATSGHARRFGSLYFGVGMPVPDSIVREGVWREEDPGERDRRETMLGGVICIAIGLAWPLLKALSARPGTSGPPFD